MKEKSLRVQMLGKFSIESEDKKIDDSDNRSRKLWLLLAYMIYRRHDIVEQRDLEDLLWGKNEHGSNPANALKTMFFRVRSMLNTLWDHAGYELIVRRNGNYAWNTDIHLELDTEEFEFLCQTGNSTESGESRPDCYIRAIELYKGDFLPRLSEKAWVVPIAAHYHHLYMETVLRLLPVLESQKQIAEAAAVCRRALEIEFYNEDLYRHLMRNLIDLNQQQEAIDVYNFMSESFYANFGTVPSDSIWALYREAVHTARGMDMAIAPEALQVQLREPHPLQGALLCDYDLFRFLYHAQARFISRSGDTIHTGLISVLGKNGKTLARRSLERASDNLREQIRKNLRQMDVASQCSASQFVLMLPQSNYENSCMICERIIKAFYRQYPHSPADIRYTVQPLEPVTGA